MNKKELRAAWWGMLISIANTVITRSATLIITLLTFAVHSLVPGNPPLDPSVAFAALALIGVLGRPMQVIPTSVTILVDAMVSLDRIEAIVSEAEKHSPTLFFPEAPLPPPPPGAGAEAEDAAAPELAKVAAAAAARACRVRMANVTAVRGAPERVVLQNVTLDITRPGLVVIAGGNASGRGGVCDFFNVWANAGG